ncbi:hypothetical protein [Leptospira bandrabouensis]|uniref:hypothetical protein n=1 Tax=Leptospira bandrabouensis TaxID=2484903 RepID=UPI001EE81AD2|nr:hypothetical protein [Leptospira bandrabouensis]MCG6144115.1 hypothetical protein [Leptospira bandrabouensis]MCG6159776.1 hypothetical protein [Leptospira bandrabouensis]MCG6163709.1 hypothetical protein [Leptospira bandrabouensis]
MLATLLTVSQALVGYSIVSYESRIVTPGQYEYFVPVQGTHFTTFGENMGTIGIQTVSPYEVYDSGWPGWRAYPAIFTNVSGYPGSNQWGRRWIPETINWNLSGDVGYKTLAEWNSLQADVTAGTKRNLIGTPVYQ